MRDRPRRWSWRLATVGGIDVRVHATMLVLVWLVLLASVDEPGGATSALLWLTLLFGSVLAHELAHSLVALHVGVHVTEIELLPIGGVSKMDRIPDRPADETAIAAAGPLMSVTIGVSSLALAALTQATIWPPDLYGGAWLPRIAWLNLLLAGFNLLPALPLDGGRVFRAALERRVGPMQATRLAARAGRWFAIAMIAVGALVNVWLIIIGVFVYVASESEEAGAVIREQLGRLRARDVMIRHPVVVAPDMTVGRVAQLLQVTAQRQFPVMDGNRYVGMVDASDLDGYDELVDRLMQRTPPVAPDAPLDELAGVDPRTTAAVAVVAADAVVGLVELADVQRLARQALHRAHR